MKVIITELKQRIKYFKESEKFWIGLLREYIFIKSADRMYYVEEGQPMWPGGSAAPFAGYITKGDNPKTNSAYDQQGSISPHLPVKPEWVIGVARFDRIPLLGCVSLASRGIFTCF